MERHLPAIVFLHGTMGVSQDLEPLMAAMKDKGYTTLSFSFSGHGQSALWPEEFRIDLFSRELETFLKNHNLSDVVVFGHSIGGYVALYHKVNFEDSPIKLIVTYGTKFNWSESAVARELPMFNPEHMSEKYPHIAEGYQNKHGDRWKALLRSTAHLMQNLERIDGLTKEDFEDLEIPVTLVIGDQDRIVTMEETRAASSWLKGSKIKTLSHSKHEMERVNVKELAELIHQEIL